MKQLTQKLTKKQIKTAMEIGKLFEKNSESRLYFSSNTARVELHTKDDISRVYYSKIWADTETGQFYYVGDIDAHIENIVDDIIDQIDSYKTPVRSSIKDYLICEYLAENGMKFQCNTYYYYKHAPFNLSKTDKLFVKNAKNWAIEQISKKTNRYYSATQQLAHIDRCHSGYAKK